MNELIQDWFSKHEVTTTSIYICSLILNEQAEDKMTNTAKMNGYIKLVLAKLTKDEKITSNQQQYYYQQINLNAEILYRLKLIVFDLTNNPNLLQKDKWESKNTLLSTTNKCFPCKKKKK